MGGEFSGGSAGLPAPPDTARPRALPAARQFSTKRWLVAALAAAVAPKCALCLAGYLAAGGAAVELCSGPADDPSVAWLAGGAAGAAFLLIGLGGWRKRHRNLSGRPPSVR
jgi:hypothetical protein